VPRMRGSLVRPTATARVSTLSPGLGPFLVQQH
jgi:hypothetical protein